jgi:creatinine amidohydrolase/Fe(II)-dependent formamide hydrolase-like protein
MKKTALAFGAVFALVTAAPTALQPPAAGQQRAPDPRSRSGRDCRDNPYNCIDTPNPLPAPDTVWIEEMTWMDVRDAMRGGKTTIIIPTGGIEPSGPWLTLGKHNVVLRTTCDVIARKLGNALCAPIIPLVPEGGIDPPRGHMDTAGTISMREETFEAMLTDVVHSMKAHGFENIILIGDSGGNQRGQKAVAETLNAQWNAKPIVAHIPEYYDNASLEKYLIQLGVTKEGQKSDNLHDEPFYTLNMMVTDPNSVRWSQRVKAGKATIDGVSIADKARALELGKKVVEFHAANTVAAIRTAIANKGRPARQP